MVDRRGQLLVIWGNSPWDGHRLGAQFLAEQLSSSHHVLYVDPPLSAWRAFPTGGAPTRPVGMEEVADGVVRLRTLGPPGLRRPGLRRVSATIVRTALRQTVRRLGLPVRAVISGYLDIDPFGCCGERHRICRISDDFTVGAELGVPVQRMARAQRALAEAADAVVVVSPLLAERWARHAPVVIPNGADVERLSGGVEPVPVDLPAPIVGYSGQLSRRIDLALLEEVAARGYSLLLVGGVRSDLDPATLADLLDAPNVRWTGEVAYDDVPRHLAAMDVGLVPYAPSAFNRASFPLKLLEYLAAGVAPVSTDLPAARWLDNPLVRIAEGPAAFADAVEAASRASGERADRQALAAQHSWAARADDYVALLDRLDQSESS